MDTASSATDPGASVQSPKQPNRTSVVVVSKALYDWLIDKQVISPDSGVVDATSAAVRIHDLLVPYFLNGSVPARVVIGLRHLATSTTDDRGLGPSNVFNQLIEYTNEHQHEFTSIARLSFWTLIDRCMRALNFVLGHDKKFLVVGDTVRVVAVLQQLFDVFHNRTEPLPSLSAPVNEPASSSSRVAQTKTTTSPDDAAVIERATHTMVALRSLLIEPLKTAFPHLNNKVARALFPLTTNATPLTSLSATSPPRQTVNQPWTSATLAHMYSVGPFPGLITWLSECQRLVPDLAELAFRQLSDTEDGGEPEETTSLQ